MNAPEKLTTRIKLPSSAGKVEEFRLSAPRDFGTAGRNPWLDAAVDWDATLAYRRYLWSLGLGVAEAMDTAQRGMGLEWNNSLELIRRSIEVSGDIEGAMLFSGAGTDQLAPSSGVTLDEVVAAYEEQCEAIERLGGRIVLMASRALATCARSSDDYQRVYRRVLSQTRQPVIIHWLGEMFDPQLTGYWGEENHGRAMNVALAVIEANRAKVDGIKISLLDRQKEVDMRRRLPQGVRMYTGDDFNYPDLIEGDAEGHSDALLGIFDAIAPAASAALDRLASGDAPGARRSKAAEAAGAIASKMPSRASEWPSASPSIRSG